MDSITILCPNCDKIFTVNEPYINVHCVYCNFLIETKNHPYIICICNCGKQHKIWTPYSNKTALCQNCSSPIRLPYFSLHSSEETNIMQESHKVHQKKDIDTLKNEEITDLWGDDDWVGSDNPIVLNEIEKQCINFYQKQKYPYPFIKNKDYLHNQQRYSSAIDTNPIIAIMIILFLVIITLLYCYISNFRYQKKNNPIDIPTIQSEEMEQEKLRFPK